MRRDQAYAAADQAFVDGLTKVHNNLVLPALEAPRPNLEAIKRMFSEKFELHYTANQLERKVIAEHSELED